MLITTALSIIGVLDAVFFPAFASLVVMRFVIGAAVGSASMDVPLNLSETAPPQIHRALVSLNQLSITSGILTTYPVDYGLASSDNWQLMFGLASTPATTLLPGALFRHENSHLLITQGREDEARVMMHRVPAITDIEAKISKEREFSHRKSCARELPDPTVPGALIVEVPLATFQQVACIKLIIYYTPTALHDVGLKNSAPLLAT